MISVSETNPSSCMLSWPMNGKVMEVMAEHHL
jgi:hypothetical protein